MLYIMRYFFFLVNLLGWFLGDTFPAENVSLESLPELNDSFTIVVNFSVIVNLNDTVREIDFPVTVNLNDTVREVDFPVTVNLNDTVREVDFPVTVNLNDTVREIDFPVMINLNYTAREVDLGDSGHFVIHLESQILKPRFWDLRDMFSHWDASSESWLNVHVQYCARVCVDNQLHNTHHCELPTCFPCDCDPLCSVYDTCCPRRVNNSYMEPLRDEFSHLPSSDMFQCVPLTNGTEEEIYYMISNCDPKLSNNVTNVSSTMLHLMDQCRNPDTKTMDDVTPYSDVYYGIVYKNKFCALCNGYTVGPLDNNTYVQTINSTVKIASPWSIKISCSHFQNLYHFTSEYEFFNAASRKRNSNCKVTFINPKSHFSPKNCPESVNVKTDIKCTSENILEQDLCWNITGRSMSVRGYQNVFCVLCANDSLQCRYPTSGHRGPQQPMPLSLLLSVTKRESWNVDGRCPLSSEWMDSDGECKKASCSPGKIITPEGHCVTSLKAIRGLGYNLALTLRPVIDVALTEEEIRTSHLAIYRKLKSTTNEVDMVNIDTNEDKSSRYFRIHSFDKYVGNNTRSGINEVDLITKVFIKRDPHSYYEIQSYYISAQIVADSNITRDMFEKHMLQMLTSAWEIDLNTSIGKKITLKPLFLGKENNLNVLKLEYFANLQRRYDETGIWWLTEKFIDITHSLICPYVEVNVSMITVADWEIHISFEYDGGSYSVQGDPDISLVEGQVRICLERFKMITKQRSSQLMVILYYFQVICISASVACLILSLVTYFLFTSLRSLPGLNNISLCVSLATAQTSLLVTAEYGVHGHLTSGFCLFNAILLHFSWLASFAWMSACCIHMYLAFTSVSVHRNVGSSDRRRHIRYCLYGYGTPALIVTLTLTLNVAMTSGASVGYDDAICFLDTRTSILTVVLSLLVPLCVMVISNGVLFTLTLREIFSVAEVQKSSSVTERRGVITYVKLSTLTGISCVISAAGVWLDNDILQLITCPLMALQGVFIFFSFIFNKRVGKMYYDLFRLHRFGFTFATSDVMKQTSRSKEAISNKGARLSTQSTEI
ncbi:hypothetical protein Btru_010080 [Bulinus truncatus]|nr:hypothetical protein Btru_010080 [Bulinus truncatus]